MKLYCDTCNEISSNIVRQVRLCSVFFFVLQKLKQKSFLLKTLHVDDMGWCCFSMQQVFNVDFYLHFYLSTFFVALLMMTFYAAAAVAAAIIVLMLLRPSTCYDPFSFSCSIFYIFFLLCDFYILFARPFTVYVLQLTWACP